jgi:hypothetical protein
MGRCAGGESFVTDDLTGGGAPELQWGDPVSAVGRGLGLFTIEGPNSAYAFLRDEWPAQQGVFFSNACKAASAAFGGSLSLSEARQAFVRACEDAGCLVRRRQLS